jgi:hypothetical protein
MNEQSTICFRATPTERSIIERIAAENHRTVSDQIRWMIAKAGKYLPVKIERTDCNCNPRNQKGTRKAGKGV